MSRGQKPISVVFWKTDTLWNVDSNKAEEFGQWLKRYRESKEIAQGDFAQQIGVTQAHLSRVENGGRGVSAELVLAVAKALQLSPLEALQQAGFWEQGEPAPLASRQKTSENAKIIDEMLSRLTPEQRSTGLDIIRAYVDSVRRK